MDRKDFLRLTAAGAAAAGTRLLATAADGQPAAASKPATIAMPISAAPLVRPDFDRSLADMRERGGVNALLPFVYTHETTGPGWPTTPRDSGAAISPCRT